MYSSRILRFNGVCAHSVSIASVYPTWCQLRKTRRLRFCFVFFTKIRYSQTRRTGQQASLQASLLGLLWSLLSISVCRLRERGRVSKSVYVRVLHDLELLRYMFFVVRSNDSFNFPLGWIKYIVTVASPKRKCIIRTCICHNVLLLSKCVWF